MTKKYSIVITVLFCLFTPAASPWSACCCPTSASPRWRTATSSRPPSSAWRRWRMAPLWRTRRTTSPTHIVGRDFWVALKAWGERVSGKQENNGIYFAKDQTLISRVDDPDMDKVWTDMGYLDQLAGTAGVPVYFGLIPTAAAVWADKLPQGAPHRRRAVHHRPALLLHRGQHHRHGLPPAPAQG